MKNFNESGDAHITLAQAQEEINKLSPDLKAIADKYLALGVPPKTALELAQAQEAINKLSPDLKAIADKYLGYGLPPKTALELAQAQEEINKLSPDLKAIADKYLGYGVPPKDALDLAYQDFFFLRELDMQTINELKENLLAKNTLPEGEGAKLLDDETARSHNLGRGTVVANPAEWPKFERKLMSGRRRDRTDMLEFTKLTIDIGAKNMNGELIDIHDDKSLECTTSDTIIFTGSPNRIDEVEDSDIKHTRYLKDSDGKTVEEHKGGTYEFNPKVPGRYTIKYRVDDGGYQQQKIISLVVGQ